MTQRRVVFTLFGVLVLVSLLLAVPSYASQARIVRLSQLDGDVQIDRAGLGMERAVLNMPVVEGTRLVAEDDATVEIEFENSSTVRMVGPAAVYFRELSMRSEGEKVTLVELQPGTYYFNVKVKDDDEFRIRTTDQTLRLRKSSHFRVEARAEEVRVAVFKGELLLDGHERELAVKKSETLTLDVNDRSRYYLAKGIEELPSDSWDEERAEYRERFAQAEGWKYANNSYGSPYSYGFTDLNYYGNYFNVPGYGWLWRPSYFNAGWDPFSNGAWSYYPGHGWMFVSLHPWGWAPYRYGQWVWVPAHGWCWSPGHRYNIWHPVPIVRNPPSRWRRPSPPPDSTWRRTVVVNRTATPPGAPPEVGSWRRRDRIATPDAGSRNSLPTVIGPAGRRGERSTWTGARGVEPDANRATPATPPSTSEPTPIRTPKPSGAGGDNDRAPAGTWRRPADAPAAPPAQRTVTPPPATTRPPATTPAPTSRPPRTMSAPTPRSAPAPRSIAPAPSAPRMSPGTGSWSRPSAGGQRGRGR